MRAFDQAPACVIVKHANPCGVARAESPLAAYEAERLPMTADVVLRNRVGGPERVIDEVERRAPDGFDDLDAVITGGELEEIFTGYHRASGNTR